MSTDDSDIKNVVIIGGGAAGLSAALYLARAGLKPMVVAGSPPGGQLMLTSEVENFPGQESILGGDLIQVMRKQASKFGSTIIDENVLSTDLAGPIKSIVLGGKKEMKAKSVIIATGAKALWMGLESETRLRGKGVSACATCDGFFFKNKTVAVIGGGDSALEEALTLTKFATNVYIVHRREEFKASKIMQERVKNHPQIHLILNATVEEVIGVQRVEGVRVKIRPSDQSLLQKTEQEIEDIAPKLLNMKVEKKESEYIVGQFPVDGVFVAIGHRPDTDIFKGQIELDEKGYILTTAMYALLKIKNQKSKIKDGLFNLDFQTATSIAGVFAAGDCVDHVYRQASTAAGMGVQAALDAERSMEKA